MPFSAREEAVRSVELSSDLRFPDSLRLRYLRDNGGELSVGEEPWQLHPVWDETNRNTIQRTTSHVLHETEEARGWHGFPQDAVAIASDGCGNYIVLLPGSDQFWRWDHETTELADVTELVSL